MTRWSRSSAALVLVVSAAAAAQGCAATEPEPPAATPTATVSGPALDDPTVLITFEDEPRGKAVSAFEQRGSLDERARALTTNGGRVTVEEGPEGGHARLPAFDRSPSGARAVIVLEPEEGDESLDPGDGDFRFGAKFALDRVSEGHGGDNGNNLVQRGLAADATQYKLQVERGKASCRVAGSGGEVVVKSRSSVQPDTWYTLTCTRQGDELSLKVEAADGTVDEVSANGDMGSVVAEPGTPLVVGGKVDGAGRVLTGNSDQFNGAVDDVFVALG